jgi:SAM-dependent methyltransferase
LEEMMEISQLDIDNLGKLRANICKFLDECAKRWDKKADLLDIAPLPLEGAIKYFKKAKIVTLDIDPTSGCDLTLDICETNKIIPANIFDMIVCTEVLEHVVNPFRAVDEMERILSTGGLIFVSTPFNFRIHKPLPDCWRFTEHGLKQLFRNWEIIELKELETPDRWLMPISYTLVGRKQ